VSYVVIAQEWQNRPLIEVATLQRGYDLPIQNRTEGPFPIFAANGPLGFHGIAKCKGPGVVTGRSGTIGKVHFVEGDYWPLNTSLYVKNFHGNDPRWVYYLLQSFGLERFSQGAGVPTLNRNLVHGEPIRVPPLPEQRRIAAILDQADALRAKRREALAQLDSLTQSIFIEMFGDPATNPKGWPIRRIGDLLESASYGTSEKSGADGKFPVLRMNNLTRTGEIDLASLKYMDLPESEYERYLVKSGDVLFNRTNSAELVGKTAIYRHTESVAYAGYLVRLRANPNNDAEYIAGFLNSSYSKRMLRGMCKSIIGMANINATEVQAMKIATPPTALQRQFGERIRAVVREKQTHRTSLAKFDQLFASLQHRAFRGEL
jgi:type I restriction enzyme S subunit